MRLSNVKKPAFQAHTHWAQSEPTRLVFLRHGETAWNVRRVIQGWRGTGLNALGLRQASLAAGRFRKMGPRIDYIVSSDLKRAMQTAMALGKALRLPVVARQDLRERNFGDWEGRSINQVLAKYKLGKGQRADPFLAFEPKGGESMAVFAQRMRRVLVALEAEYRGQTVAVVTHGGPVRIATCLACGIPPKKYFLIGKPGNTSVAVLAHQGGIWWMESYNDMAHLETPSPRRGRKAQ